MGRGQLPRLADAFVARLAGTHRGRVVRQLLVVLRQVDPGGGGEQRVLRLGCLSEQSLRLVSECAEFTVGRTNQNFRYKVSLPGAGTVALAKAAKAINLASLINSEDKLLVETQFGEGSQGLVGANRNRVPVRTRVYGRLFATRCGRFAVRCQSQGLTVFAKAFRFR